MAGATGSGEEATEIFLGRRTAFLLTAIYEMISYQGVRSMFKHPNFLDRIAARIYPRYLYPGQEAQVVVKIGVGVMGRVPGNTKGIAWSTKGNAVKIMNSSRLQPGSIVKFLGLARDLKFLSKEERMYSIFEVVKPVEDLEAEREVAIRDVVAVTPVERMWVHPEAVLPSGRT